MTYDEYQRLAVISDEAQCAFWRAKDAVENEGMICSEHTLILFRDAKIDLANKVHETLVARSKWMTKMKEYEDSRP